MLAGHAPLRESKRYLSHKLHTGENTMNDSHKHSSTMSNDSVNQAKENDTEKFDKILLLEKASRVDRLT